MLVSNIIAQSAYNFLSPTQQVFAVEELPDYILEYATFTGTLKELLSLRLVSKSWRKSLFKILTSRPPVEVVIGVTENISAPSSLPPSCFIPIGVNLLLERRKQLSLQHIDFLNKYAFNLAKIKFNKLVDSQLQENYNTFLRFELPNLKQLEVRMEYDTVYYSPASVVGIVLKNICDNAPQLKSFKVIIDQSTKFESAPLPASVTDLVVGFGTDKDLSKIFRGSHLPRLQTLVLHSLETFNEQSKTLTYVLNKFYKTLKVLKVSVPNGRIKFGLNIMKSLQDISISSKSACIFTQGGLSVTLPNLQKLSIVGHLKHKQFLREGEEEKFDKLETLSITSAYGNIPRGKQECLLQELLLFLVPMCPNLKRLSLTKLPVLIGRLVFAFVCASFGKLTHLEFSIASLESARLEFVDWLNILTGVRSDQVTGDLRDPDFEIEGDRNDCNISNLKSLHRLKLGSYHHKPFLFSEELVCATFRQMHNFRELILSGSIQVEENQ